MILVFGSINMDLFAEVAAIPRPGETVLSPSYAHLFGGKGANQAVAAARVAGPGGVAMVGCVGDDPFGRMCTANLAANGVDVSAIALTEQPTGCAFITVDRAGQNAITVASGANARPVASAVPDELLGADTTGIFQMEVPFPASLEVARRLKARGGRVTWNFAPVPADFTREELDALLAATDVFVVNEIEARSAAALLGVSDLGLDADAQALAAFGGTTCIVTAGEHGAIAFTPDGKRHLAPALAIRPIDTTGAGDTFVGVLAAGLDAGKGFGTALREACIGGSLACRAKGAQAAMPDRAELQMAISSARIAR
ncbi:ribokinase [Bosea caraganae]|uniref:Ribokinase n=1 Tax=Bosea caraganae TaxID=2763117 RepID=A0A370KXU2_9HYPH|nr:ribokinase [Bosea caraganae]RDJ19788.1 ribokinase [Bosea caraganae]RDJ21108.1 ribokinase [Bosea caraganae]